MNLGKATQMPQEIIKQIATLHLALIQCSKSIPSRQEA
jgi:hypothetical protein